MKNSSLKYFVILFFSFALITGCSDDNDNDGEEVTAFAGDYIISSASVTEEFDIIINGPTGPIDFTVDEGMDITTAIQDALLGQIDCDSPANSYVELREDNSMYLSCSGENELDAGTWDEVSVTEIKLNLNASAVPSSPAGISLTITDISVSGSEMSGFTSVPLTADMIEALLPLGLTLAPENAPIFIVKLSLTFVKQ